MRVLSAAERAEIIEAQEAAALDARVSRICRYSAERWRGRGPGLLGMVSQAFTTNAIEGQQHAALASLRARTLMGVE